LLRTAIKNTACGNERKTQIIFNVSACLSAQYDMIRNVYCVLTSWRIASLIYRTVHRTEKSNDTNLKTRYAAIAEKAPWLRNIAMTPLRFMGYNLHRFLKKMLLCFCPMLTRTLINPALKIIIHYCH